MRKFFNQQIKIMFKNETISDHVFIISFWTLLILSSFWTIDTIGQEWTITHPDWAKLMALILIGIVIIITIYAIIYVLLHMHPDKDEFRN